VVDACKECNSKKAANVWLSIEFSDYGATKICSLRGRFIRNLSLHSAPPYLTNTYKAYCKLNFIYTPLKTTHPRTSAKGL